MEITPVESTPERIVEEGRSGRGMRRVMAPVMRAYLRKQNGRALERLKEQLEAR